MGNRFDIAAKFPFDVDPAGMLTACGLTVDGPVSPYKTDLSTRLEADRLFRVEGKRPWLAHVEIQSGPDQFLDLRLERYNIAAEYQVALESEFREHLPVLSTLFLLQQTADSSKLSGRRDRIGRNGKRYGTFRYNVVRLWQIPIEDLLSGPVALLAFATLGKADKEEIPTVVKRLEERLTQEVKPDVARDLRISAWLLMGLKFTPDVVFSCPWRRELMQESSTYRWLIDEGMEQGLVKGREEGREEGFVSGKRDELIRQGKRKLGPATKTVQKTLNSISDPAMIERIMDELENAGTWSELLRFARKLK